MLTLVSSGFISNRNRSLQSTTRSHLSLCSSSLSVVDMDGGTGASLYPLHRCKTIHLVRHAQGLHNVDGDKNYKAYLSPEYFDAPVTQLGWQQIENLRKHVHDSGLFKRIDLVIASPLLRTLQTAVGVFGGGDYVDRMDVVPLMVANAGNSNRSAISSLNSPPIIGVELCREHLGVHPCDKRRNVSDYQFLFPAVDFSLIESDEDILWKANVRETNEEVAARGLKFMNWLWTRKEKEIAIVTHRGFLNHTLNAFGNDCHPFVKKEISKHFANCELRSMVIIDRSMTGSNSSTTDYPGKIPPALNLPRDIAEKSNSYPESGDSSPRSRDIDFENPPPWDDNQNPPNYKAKFMCSYNGKIHPRPHDNQLAYIGGDTKILAVDRNIKFASMISKLAALCADNDVSFKYQLPGEDLDALISVTNDDDLEHMMNEYDRLFRASAKPARMRLFLFPASTASSFGSDGSKTDRDRFVEALNSGPTHVVDSKKIPNNVDFLFGLEKGIPIPAQKIPEPVAVPPPPPEYQVADDRGIGRDRVVYSDHGLNPVEIQRQLQRLQIREQQQHHHHHHHEQQQIQEAVYMRKSDDNYSGVYMAPPASLPVQQTTSFLPEKQIPAPNYAGNVTTTHVQQEQPVYMIPAPTAAPGTATTTTVYHHHVQPGAAQPPMMRQVTGQSGQQYYPNMQRMAPGPDVYREQQPVYNMVVPPPQPQQQQTQALPPPMTTATPPSLPQMGMVRPGGGGGGGVAMTETGYTQVAYDSGVGRQVYYTAPGGGMVVPPQYQGVGMAVSGGAGGAGGGLSQEGKVVGKVSQASV